VASVTFEHVAKIYDGGVRAVNNLNLDVADGELLVLVGPSGCGKSTLLRCIAGLEELSRGAILMDGADITRAEPRDRDIAMVFQSYALYPHLSVYENIAFGLRVKKVPKAEIDQRVNEAARTLGLEALLKRKPRALSGGQRQRVAMGRAIVRHPQAFLMDEPLSNLDAKLRVQTRAEIARLQRELEVTTIYVTHDQVEAMTMGNRVAVMRRGELQQVAPTQELYDRPVNLFVAGFIGSPSMNLVEATIGRAGERYTATIGSDTIVLDDEALEAHPAIRNFDGRMVVLGVRPESLDDAAIETDSPPDRRLRGSVVLTEALGSEILVHVSIDARAALTEELRELEEDIEGAPSESDQERSTIIVCRFNPRSRVQVGDTVQIAVDTRSLHFFDQETGLGIYRQSN
jgi:multiple sugar transport system ATP-binding protein